MTLFNRQITLFIVRNWGYCGLMDIGLLHTVWASPPSCHLSFVTARVHCPAQHFWLWFLSPAGHRAFSRCTVPGIEFLMTERITQRKNTTPRCNISSFCELFSSELTWTFHAHLSKWMHVAKRSSPFAIKRIEEAMSCNLTAWKHQCTGKESYCTCACLVKLRLRTGKHALYKYEDFLGLSSSSFLKVVLDQTCMAFFLWDSLLWINTF